MYHRFKWTKVSHRRNWISREYEPLQPYFLMALSNSVGATTFADVGANIGLYSVFMSQTVEQVIAFEANDALATEVKGNFSLNGINGSVRQVAVTDQPGTVRFGIVSRYAGNSAVAENEDEGTAYNTVETVDAVRLDDELAKVAGPIALKVDVEGHELSVLEGARDTLSRKKCVVQIENFEDAVDSYMSKLNLRKLTSIGPDAYFTNVDSVDPKEIYEQASAALIEANHEHKSMVLSGGDIGVVVSGKLYHVVRKTAQKLLGKRL